MVVLFWTMKCIFQSNGGQIASINRTITVDHVQMNADF